MGRWMDGVVNERRMNRRGQRGRDVCGGQGGEWEEWGHIDIN